MNEVVAPSATVFGQTVEPAGIVSKDLRIHRIEGIVLQVPLPVLSKAVTGPLRNALTVLTRQARHDHGDAVCLDSKLHQERVDEHLGVVGSLRQNVDINAEPCIVS